MTSFRRVLAAGAGLAMIACGLGACDKKPAPAAAPAPSGMPPLDQPSAPQPPAADRPVHAPSGSAEAPGALPPGHPPLGGAAAAPAAGGPGADEPATPGDIPFDAKTVLAGVIKLDPKVKDKVKDGDAIFLVARAWDPSGAPGQLLAVKKLTAAKFPIAFSLDSRDAMIAGAKIASGKVVLIARVDKDGDALTKNPGDVSGQTKALVPPQQKIVLNLDTVL